jgi:hypothetical protein
VVLESRKFVILAPYRPLTGSVVVVTQHLRPLFSAFYDSQPPNRVWPRSEAAGAATQDQVKVARESSAGRNGRPAGGSPPDSRTLSASSPAGWSGTWLESGTVVYNARAEDRRSVRPDGCRAKRTLPVRPSRLIRFCMETTPVTRCGLLNRGPVAAESHGIPEYDATSGDRGGLDAPGGFAAAGSWPRRRRQGRATRAYAARPPRAGLREYGVHQGPPLSTRVP